MSIGWLPKLIRQPSCSRLTEKTILTAPPCSFGAVCCNQDLRNPAGGKFSRFHIILVKICQITVEMPTILAAESTLQSEVIRLMPTIQGSPASHVYLGLLLPNGTLQEYDIPAPTMKVGGKYELRLNYNKMQPKMNLETTINGWTEAGDNNELIAQ